MSTLYIAIGKIPHSQQLKPIHQQDPNAPLLHHAQATTCTASVAAADVATSVVAPSLGASSVPCALPSGPNSRVAMTGRWSEYTRPLAPVEVQGAMAPRQCSGSAGASGLDTTQHKVLALERCDGVCVVTMDNLLPPRRYVARLPVGRSMLAMLHPATASATEAHCQCHQLLCSRRSSALERRYAKQAQSCSASSY